MASERLTTVLDELRAEEADLQERLESLRVELKCGEAQLTQVRKALTSLKDKSSNGTNAKRTATREEVIEAMREVIRERGTVSETDLKRLVEERISAQGRSRVGLLMRMRSALKEAQFVRRGNVFGLGVEAESDESERETAN
ncbi:MAG: hypothetical protein DWQ34_25910 [Planctomycetota bacterium]|nr:MAG: hypothetical protein DWQ34_25910 [Planctomycetota bacterium]REK25850.1 MAG: hypothetical protein DWQ41_11055 [Planctomycetota bacterium]REK37129.1 MAG: hypothetical protein DWQ45_07865 [Planctomycetota bacterium]